MEMILVNSLSQLSDAFIITIEGENVVFTPKNDDTASKDIKVLRNILFVKSYQTMEKGGSLYLHFSPIISSVEVEGSGTSIKYVPDLRVKENVSPQKGQPLTMKKGQSIDVFFVEYNAIHKCIVVEDTNGFVFYMEYAALRESRFERGRLYKISCLGKPPESKRDPYPRMQFEIALIND
jgi:hypothetical protein